LSGRVLHIDFETRSPVDLKKTGTYVYADSKDTDVWCAAYAFDDHAGVADTEIKLWKLGEPCPQEIADHVSNDGLIYAHNAAFERTIWNRILGPRYGWPVPTVEQWRCTMAMALAMSLPGSLENASGALGLAVEKDMKGHALMLRMARPRTRNDDGSLVWWTDPERLERLYDYCRNDVVVERALHQRMLALRPFEERIWQLDQIINDRGVDVDVELCEAAKKVVAETQARLNKEMMAVTDCEVGGATKVQELTRWCRVKGVPVDSLKKEDLLDLLLREDLPPEVRRALEIRQEAGKTSVSKIDALLRGRNADNRARGLLQYHAAGTGRWGGRRFQPQNLKRPDEETDIDAAIQAILDGRKASTIEALFGPPLSIVGDCIRGMVTAKAGKKLVTADFSNIEGRVLAWLAGEKWKLDAFREFDAGRAPDLYIQSYAKTFGVPIFDKKDPRRKTGKVMELASGYQGGHGAYLKMGAKGKSLAALVDTVRAATDPDEWDEVAAKHNGNGFGLTLDQWTGLRIVIDRWRQAHSKIYRFWFDLEDAAVEAVANPGRRVVCGRLQFKKAGSFLFLRLPSGRCLVYPYPRLEETTTPWGAKKQTVVYKGIDSRTQRKVWGDIYTYGGLWAENVTQAVARDLLAEAMIRVEEHGYEIVLHVHDEIVAEVPSDFGSVEEFEELMSELPEWADGCPVAAEGWQGKRYRK
jgi:DNA polymerase